ncbi:hypothetical protein GCM10025870_10830 [Agromyces marinus]|uniref:Uncharacterized protein n=1 Tax=Agromyces marinus TaxID=1389020 RepID=A0ABM8GZW9_9MICO|nr:hypothetical protein [Agromyces marinus]BDZ54010.1 hypothetical protein GCM10025870_10830 [Agromyces marinus]
MLGELAHELRLVRVLGRRRDHRDAPVAHLPSVAVRAQHDAPPPLLGEARDLGKLVDEPRRDEHAPRDQALTGVEDHLERDPVEAAGCRGIRFEHGRVGDLARPGRDVVPRQLGPARREQVCGRRVIAAEHAVHVRGGAAARAARIHDEHAPTRPAEHERGAQPGAAAADDDHIPHGRGLAFGHGAWS